MTSLPAAEVEEEVVETPLDALYDEMDTRSQGQNKSKENRGHLEFEIRSDDGFSCKSDTADGTIVIHQALRLFSTQLSMRFQLLIKIKC